MLVIVVVALYFARAVFIPLALAVLLAFLLAPLATRLRHLGLGRVLSSLVVVLLAFLVLTVMGGFMASQLADLAHKLPGYEQNVYQKLAKLRDSGGGIISRVTRVVRSVSEELTPSSPANRKTLPGEEKPVPVEIRPTTFAPLEMVRTVLGSVLS